jgi:RNA polymerase sigma-70 factor (ECF subfamily)
VVAGLRRTRPTHPPPAGDDPDAVVVSCAQRDPEAFAPLYVRYVEEIARFCYVRLRDEDAARDAAQQVFTRALAGLAGYREQGQFRAWLYAITRNVLAGDARRRRPTVPLDAADVLADPGASPEDAAARSAESQALLAAVARLPDDQRFAVELRLAGLSGPEVAAAMGRSHDAIRKLQLRAMERLRADLGDAVDAKGAAHDAR